VLWSRGYEYNGNRKIFLLLRAVNANCATHLRFLRLDPIRVFKKPVEVALLRNLRRVLIVIKYHLLIEIRTYLSVHANCVKYEGRKTFFPDLFFLKRRGI